jgi:anti-sigma B factor antagonist
VIIEQTDSEVRLALSGELDISTAPRLEEDLRRVEAGRPSRIVLDLERLEFLDSTGLRLLILADNRARDEGRQLAVARANEMVRRVFRLTRLDERLTLQGD